MMFPEASASFFYADEGVSIESCVIRENEKIAYPDFLS